MERKVAIRMAYGFRHVNNLIVLVMLRCGGLDMRLPQPARKRQKPFFHRSAP